MASGQFTIGVEEELALIDPTSRALRADVEDVYPAARDAADSDDEVAHELHQTQIEIGTPVCETLDEVRTEILRLRAQVAAAAAEHGLVIAAAATHPLAAVGEAQITDEPTYRAIEHRYAQLAREQVVFGCHVHVGVTDRELAVAAMNALRPWLPVLVALSASSPYWDGVDTDYASYRTEVFGRWPTAGPPEAFASRADLDDVVAQLLATQAIDDPARIYWDARPSARFETLEVRAADVCTSADDAVAIAGLCGGLVRAGVTAAEAGEPAPTVRPELLRAARWRAARYGLTGQLVDLVDLELRPAADVVGHLLEVISPALDAWGELHQVSTLVDQLLRRGTSAQRQRDAFAAADGSLDGVVDWLVAETART